MGVAPTSCVYTSTTCQTGMDTCLTYTWTQTATVSGVSASVKNAVGICTTNSTTGDCGAYESTIASSNGVSEWTCEACTTNDCNPETKPTQPTNDGAISGATRMVTVAGVIFFMKILTV